MFTTPYDGYGTSAPAWTSSRMFLGNDAGVLMAYSSQPGITVEAPQQSPEQDTNSLVGLAAVTSA